MKLSATLALGLDRPSLPYLYRGDVDVACAAIAELGFAAVELLLSHPSVLPPAALEAALTRHGLALSAIGTGGAYQTRQLHLCSPDPAVREAAAQYVRDTIDLAAPFGGLVILGSVMGLLDPAATRDMALAWLVPALNRLGDEAARKETRLLIEPLNRYESNFINRLADGLALIERLDTSGVGLLADLFHMNIEEPSIPDAIRQAGPALGHVHFVDSNRQAPGFGHLDYAPILAALGGIGYNGWLSAEVLPVPSPTAAARQVVVAWQRWSQPVAGLKTGRTTK